MSNNLVKTFGKNLKKIREERGLTQEELAFKVNLNRTYIGRIERGERSISLATIDKIASRLHVEPKNLFQSNNQKSKYNKK